MNASDILKRAAQHMEDRAAARDKPEGERSMARTVTAFNALTGHSLSERDGWLFMAVLKAARACSTASGVADDYEDGAAYFALAGESVTVLDQGSVAPKGRIDYRTMRAVPVEGHGVLQVPPGYNWIAQDRNGSWWAYESRPSPLNEIWSLVGIFEPISQGKPNPNWRDTLRQVCQ